MCVYQARKSFWQLLNRLKLDLRRVGFAHKCICVCDPKIFKAEDTYIKAHVVQVISIHYHYAEFSSRARHGIKNFAHGVVNLAMMPPCITKRL